MKDGTNTIAVMAMRQPHVYLSMHNMRATQPVRHALPPLYRTPHTLPSPMLHSAMHMSVQRCIAPQSSASVTLPRHTNHDHLMPALPEAANSARLTRRTARAPRGGLCPLVSSKVTFTRRRNLHERITQPLRVAGGAPSLGNNYRGRALPRP
jgi:hypothetical protein